jgi:putative transposase
MRAYSKDLREKVIAALESGEYTQPEIAENFLVSLRFVEGLWQRWKSTGSYEALPHGGGKKRVLGEFEDILRAAIAKQPDLTLDQLCEKVMQAKGIKANKSMMCREIKRLNLPVKKSRSTTAKEIRPE